MIIDEFVSKVQEISGERNYWFVRTDSGLYFETYVSNNFIGIGWNSITVDDMTNRTIEEVKAKIAKAEGLDIDMSNQKSTISGIYNKLKYFKDLRNGDIIICPSEHSSRYAFGVIETNNIEVDVDGSHECEYQKRRKVKWLAVKNTASELSPSFYPMRRTQHSISSINDYAPHIDAVTNNLYLKAGFAHFVIDIKKRDDINLKSLLEFISSMQSLAVDINNDFELNEPIDASTIKLSLQSKGIIEFIFQSGKTLITLAAILSIASCGNPNIDQIENPEIKEFVQSHSDTLRTIAEKMQDLDVDTEKILSIQ